MSELDLYLILFSSFTAATIVFCITFTPTLIRRYRERAENELYEQWLLLEPGIEYVIVINTQTSIFTTSSGHSVALGHFSEDGSFKRKTKFLVKFKDRHEECVKTTDNGPLFKMFIQHIKPK